jgi:hypothetical protein
MRPGSTARHRSCEPSPIKAHGPGPRAFARGLARVESVRQPRPTCVGGIVAAVHRIHARGRALSTAARRGSSSPIRTNGSIWWAFARGLARVESVRQPRSTCVGGIVAAVHRIHARGRAFSPVARAGSPFFDRTHGFEPAAFARGRALSTAARRGSSSPIRTNGSIWWAFAREPAWVRASSLAARAGASLRAGPRGPDATLRERGARSRSRERVMRWRFASGPRGPPRCSAHFGAAEPLPVAGAGVFSAGAFSAEPAPAPAMPSTRWMMW